ncbi:MAG: hypothetical protein R2851_00225 [Caldilineaceae bacterium]
MDLRAQRGVGHADFAQLAEDAQHEFRALAQVIPAAAGVEERAHHRAEGPPAEDQMVVVEAGREHIPTVDAQIVAQGQFVVAVDDGVDLVHGHLCW